MSGADRRNQVSGLHLLPPAVSSLVRSNMHYPSLWLALEIQICRVEFGEKGSPGWPVNNGAFFYVFFRGADQSFNKRALAHTLFHCKLFFTRALSARRVHMN